jgi:hypothetical protein
MGRAKVAQSEIIAAHPKAVVEVRYHNTSILITSGVGCWFLIMATFAGPALAVTRDVAIAAIAA